MCFRVKNQPHTSFPDSLPAAFAASKRARAVGGVLLGAMLALGGLWLLLSSGALSEPGLQRVLAVLAVVTGVVFARQMLVRPTAEELASYGEPDFTVLAAPGYRWRMTPARSCVRPCRWCCSCSG